MSDIRAGDQGIKTYIFIHWNNALLVNTGYILGTILEINPRSLMEESPSDLVAGCWLPERLDIFFILELVHQGKEDRIVMIQDVWRVVGVEDVSAEHCGAQFAIFDELLDVLDLCDVPEVSFLDLVGVGIHVVFVEERAGFDHLLEGLVLVGAALMLNGKLPHENLAGLHLVWRYNVNVDVGYVRWNDEMNMITCSSSFLASWSSC